MEKMEQYLVPSSAASETMIERKSRFIGHIWPVETEEEAVAYIKQTREKYWDATHNVYAYVLKSGTMRYSDDGEPGGTAGMPVLNVLRQEELWNVCCVVTRYFGGTLLGAGGLVRAYSKTAKLALDAAGISMKRVWNLVEIPCSYSLFERVRQEVTAFQGLITDSTFAAEVLVKAILPEEQVEGFLLRLQDLSNGKIRVQIIERQYRAFPVGK